MRFRLAPPFLAALLLLAGCRDAKVASYRTPHEEPEPLPPILTGGLPAAASATPAAPDMPATPSASPAAGAGMNAMASTAVPTADGDSLRWTAPAHWQAKPVSAMRKGSYAVPGAGGATADLSITAFPGDVGGELANLNRWRGQLELPPLTAADLPAATTRSEHDGLSFVVVDFANPAAAKPQRILGALVPFGGATWFFKLMGPDALVAAEKPAFLAFLQTVQPPAAATP